MARVPNYFNFGNIAKETSPELVRALSLMYTTLARAINGVNDPNENFTLNAPQVYTTGSAPAASAQINQNFQAQY